MGCSGSKNEVEDPRRAKQAEKRKKSQERLRPEDEEKQTQLTSTFENEAANWPSRPAWYLKGKNTQGVNVLIAAPEQLRDQYFTVVVRNESKYTIDIGYGAETKFDASAMRLSIACSTVSSEHCKLHFSRTKKHSMLEIEDSRSLNGTFILARPDATSTRRPMLEKEVRGDRVSLVGVDYIRLGSACVLALEATNIFWDDEDDDDANYEEPQVEPSQDLVPKWLDEGWYFPMPSPPKLNEVTSKKREVPQQQVTRKNSKTGATI